MKNKPKLLSPKLLIELGFKHNKPFFKNHNMPYYVKNSICLWYNAPIQLGMESSYMIGYAEMRGGKYYSVSFKWINTLKELTKIYEAITDKKIKQQI